MTRPRSPMTYEEARRRHAAFVRRAAARTPRLVPAGWTAPCRTEEHAQAWVFVYRERTAGTAGRDQYEAVVVRKDRSGAYVLLGAIGRASRSLGPALGLPRSNERWLGSGPGRYQAFDRGLVVWHEDPGLAYGRHVAPDVLEGRRCVGLVAFFDLRGFSRWARRRAPGDVQALMSALEAVLQDAFNMEWCRLLFVKGVGDGVMVVSEQDWFPVSRARASAGRAPTRPGPPRPGHLGAFLRACARFVTEGRQVLPGDLAIACGVDVGELTQVFLFGQTDYLGEPANSAAKLQQLGWDEIILSPRVADLASQPGQDRQGLVRRGVALGDRGIRIDPVRCLRG